MIRKDDSSQQKAKRLPQVRELPRGEEGYIEPGGFLFSFVMGVIDECPSELLPEEVKHDYPCC